MNSTFLEDENHASFLDNMLEIYYDIMEKKRDRRMDGYPLMSSPLVPLAICLTYVWLVWSAGPRLMKNRPAFQLRSVLIVYNALQTIFSVVIFYMAISSGWIGNYSLACEPVDYSNTFNAWRAVQVSYLYYFSKYTEFFDTFFFVLRKKFDHISVLHVVHHGLMPFSVWWGARFFPGGHSTFFGMVNSYVHIVMYIYYMIAAMGEQYRPLIWWKKYLTTFQMIQFVAVGIHSFQLFFRECEFPTASSVYIGAHGVLYLCLFTNFYIQEYVRRKNVGNKLGGYPSPGSKSILSHPPCFLQSEYCDSVATGKMSHPMNGRFGSDTLKLRMNALRHDTHARSP